MRKLFALLAIILLSGGAFAYFAEYFADSWLKVTRNVSVSAACGGAVTGGCSATGAAASGSASTFVALRIENTGSVWRSGVEITESLVHVPDGASMSYSPEPYSVSGRSATWRLGRMAPGANTTISYSYSAAAREGQIARIPPISFVSDRVAVALSAPSRAKEGSRFEISLTTEDGAPVAGATVRVTYPDGTSSTVPTDKAGRAPIYAKLFGIYTYGVEGYLLSRIISTDVEPSAQSAPVAAMAAASAQAGDGGLFSAALGFLPAVAATFAVAVVLMMLLGFIAGRREEGEGYAPAPAKPSPAPYQNGNGGAPQVAYTQSFSFRNGEKEEKRIEDITRTMVESRKRQRAEQEGGMPPGESTIIYGNRRICESPTPTESTEIYDRHVPGAKAEQAERTAVFETGTLQMKTPREEGEVGGRKGDGEIGRHDDNEDEEGGAGSGEGKCIFSAPDEIEDELEKELEKLEEGEEGKGSFSNEDDEIEKAIAELEAIRAELAARRARVHGFPEKGEERESVAGSECEEAGNEDEEGGAGNKEAGNEDEEGGAHDAAQAYDIKEDDHISFEGEWTEDKAKGAEIPGEEESEEEGESKGFGSSGEAEGEATTESSRAILRRIVERVKARKNPSSTRKQRLKKAAPRKAGKPVKGRKRK